MRRALSGWARVGAVVAVLALSLAGTVAPTGAQDACPVHQYLGNYPHERQLEWSSEAQGIAHDARNWFFTQKNRILKLPVRSDLHVALNDQPVGWQGLEGFPTEMALRGYDHYGDPHVYGGFLFVPVESSERTAIAAFQTSNLGFVDFVEVTRFQGRAAWLAINRGQRLLYSSDGTVSGDEPLLRYTINLTPLIDDRVPRARRLDRALDASRSDAGLTLHSRLGLSRPDGQQVMLFTMQGGVFSSQGDLYLMSSPASFGLDPGGITLWNPAGRLIDRSRNSSGLGGFKYEFHTGNREEPEGIDWWNRSIGPASPSVSGQFHAILLDNDLNGDDLYVKHYKVSYRCR